jgi:hypothetical protein
MPKRELLAGDNQRRIRMNKQKMLVVLGMVLCVTSVTYAADAEKPVTFGVHGNWGDDTDLGVGGRAIFDLSRVQKGMELHGGFDYYFPGSELGIDTSYWEVNANAIYNIPMKKKTSIAPYTGAGLCLAHAKVSDSEWGFSVADSDVGLNLIGGIKINDRAYIEAKFEVSAGEQFVLTAGIRF